MQLGIKFYKKLHHLAIIYSTNEQDTYVGNRCITIYHVPKSVGDKNNFEHFRSSGLHVYGCISQVRYDTVTAVFYKLGPGGATV